MKKIIFCIAILSTLASFSSSAQFLIGPQLGFNIANLTGTSLSVNTKPGWTGGLFVSIPLDKHFSVMPAALYSMRGFKYDYTTTTTQTPKPDSTIVINATTDVNASLGYLDVPVLLTYFTGETKGFMFQFGPQMSFLITDNSKINTSATITTNNSNPQPTTPTNSNTVSFNKSDISIVGGVGYKFPQLLIVYARVATGLAKVQEGDYVKDTGAGHNFTFEAGVALSFGGK